MILQALNQYYQRLSDDPNKTIPPFGFSQESIRFALVLNQAGELVQVFPLGDDLGKRKVPKQVIVPEASVKSVNVTANFMWGNAGYVLGADEKGKPKRALETFSAFKQLHHEIGDDLDDVGMAAVLQFLDTWNPKNAPTLQYWEELAAGANLVFQLDGEKRFVHERPRIHDAWLERRQRNISDVFATCLVKGERKPISRLHQKIKRVKNAQSTGATVVSFNLDASESYGKKQNFNAPVSEEAAFNYATALNYLLNPNPDVRQRIQIGDATTVFWTERASPVEGFMEMILDPRDDAGDLVDVRLFLEAVRDGKMPHNIGDPTVQFYILGLSPNAARISVRFWHVSTVGDIRLKIGQHFKDLSMVKQYDNNPEFLSIRQVLLETFINHNSKSRPNWDNLNPLLSGTLMRSVLTGAAYPQTLLAAIIGRIRADQTINYLRAAIIKACLVRKFRINNLSEEVSMSLDKDSTNIAYRLGRLFAVLEKAQQDAAAPAKLNTTIKDRFYGSASATPRTVFPQLLRLAQHHIQKAEYGRRNDGMIEEIMQGLQKFPAHLSLDDQGTFAIGYYHQRQAFFTKKTDKKEENHD